MTKLEKSIKQKAVDTSKTIGDYYDEHQFRFIPSIYHMRVKTNRFNSSESPICTIEKSDIRGEINLLKLIGIQDELRVNLLLGIIKRVGIASLMDYRYQINEYTRFFYYSLVHQTEEMDCTSDETQRLFHSNDHHHNATHLITSIDYGIDVIAIMQLPQKKDVADRIDNILQEVCRKLSNRNCHASLNSNEVEESILLKEINRFSAYSNIPALASRTSFPGILQEIHKNTHQPGTIRPISYYLTPISSTQSPSIEVISQIETNLFPIRCFWKQLKHTTIVKDVHPFYGDIMDLSHRFYHQLRDIESAYKRIKSKLRDLLLGNHNVPYRDSTLLEELQNTPMQELKFAVENLFSQFNRVSSNTCSQSEFIPKPNMINTTSIHLHSEKIDMKYSSIMLTNTSAAQLNNHITKHDSTKHFPSLTNIGVENILYEEKGNTGELKIVSQPKNLVEKYDNSTLVTSSLDLSKSCRESEKIMNILLIGETGVGKSTFINAFVNYLTYDSLEQAEVNKAVVLIPVSFLLTVGNNFDEQIVRFGDVVDSANEDFDHPGQSATQHCKSYMFDLDDGRKLRIIDTPGFGDTRGIEQDDQNIQHILEYINNLTHIDGICFLLKPNVARLNIIFQLSLGQLVDFLGPQVHKNIIFCFTNSRSTFYAPGDTAPLVKKMLKKLLIEDIPFKKENCFCFDSESFRYLLAIKNDIEFDETEKSEYKRSWEISVEESKRLIGYIRDKLAINPIQNGFKSRRHAQFEITQLIRPILETIRNILRNQILSNSESKNVLIELEPRILHRSASLCLVCDAQAKQFGQFWIREDVPHKLDRSKCHECSCPTEKHIEINYILTYSSVYNSIYNNNTKFNEDLFRLINASARFSYFLIHVAICTKQDRFLDGLLRMIEHEKDISIRYQPNVFNKLLVEKLEEQKVNYENEFRRATVVQETNDLSVIYELLEKVNNIPIIRKQINIAKTGDEIMMKQYESSPMEI